MGEELESLGERIAEQAAHLDAALHRLLTDLRTFDRGGGWHTQGARSCAHWLSWRVGWGLGTAREHVRVADRLADLPLLDDALRRGEISYSKIRAITRVATPQNEAALLEIARLSTGHQLETVCRKYRSVLLHDADPDADSDRQRRWVTRRDTVDGMVCIEAVLHPEEAALVWAALDHCAKQQCRESHRVSADAADDIARGAGPQQQCREPHRVSADAADAAARDAGPQQLYRESHRVSADAADAAARDAGLQQQCRESHRVSADVADAAARGAGPQQQYRESHRVSADVADAATRDAGPQQQYRESHRVSAETPTAIPPAGANARDGGAHVHSVRSRAPFDRADALVQVAQGYLRGDRPDRSPIELVVSVPAETLRRRPTAADGDADAVAAPDVPDPCDVACLADGTCISAETARRLSCDCGVVEMVEDEHDVPLSVGRKRRTIPGSMKRALLQRDRTCRFPGCANRLYLEAHHIVHWADGGNTGLRNLVACCSFHHRFLHEYGCSVELHADGPHFLDRRGRRILDAPPPARPSGLGWEAILARDAELQITASTNEPLWDGAPVDYGAVIDHLVGIDQIEATRGWS